MPVTKVALAPSIQSVNSRESSVENAQKAKQGRCEFCKTKGDKKLKDAQIL